MSQPRPEGRVLFARGCRLTVVPKPWPFADENAEAIEALWAERSAANPRLFNGRIHLMTSFAMEAGDVFSGRLLQTDFKSYLLWRERGFPDRTVTDAFGSALLRSADGHILLGRQAEGYINAGLSYLPGGFIDPRDVTPDNTIDIEGSIARELAEETGLLLADLKRVPGFILTFSGALLSIAAEYRSPLPAEALKARIEAHIARDASSELTAMTFVNSPADLQDLRMPDYAQVLLNALFSATKPA